MNNRDSAKLKDIKSIAVNNRRSDEMMRRAIHEVQTHFFNSQEPDTVLHTLITQLKFLTRSEFVGCLKVKNPKDGMPLNEHTSEYINLPEDQKHSLSLNTISLWLSSERYIFRSKVYTDDVPSIYQNLFAGTSDLKSICFLPLIVNNQFIALAVIADRQIAYKRKLTARLSPLIGAVTCAIQSSKNGIENTPNLPSVVATDDYVDSLIYFSPNPVIIVRDTVIVAVNDAAIDLLNANAGSSAQVIQDFSQMTVYDVLPNFDDLFQWSNQPKSYQTNFTGQGPYIWQQQSFLYLDGTKSSVNLTVFQHTSDNKDFHTIQFQMLEEAPSTQKQAVTFDNARDSITDILPIGLIRVTPDWRCQFANEKWCEFTGLGQAECLGQGWIKAVFAEDLRYLLEDLFECITFRDELRKEIRLISSLGQIRWCDFHASVLIDDNGKAAGFVGTVTDITEHRHYATQLKLLNENDALTGINNRVGLTQKLEKACTKEWNKTSFVSVMFLDLDGFKSVNDNYGHHNGDQLLIEVARRLSNVVENAGAVARFGGDEFVVLVENVSNHSELGILSEKIIAAVAKPFDIAAKQVSVTVSIGIATEHERKLSPEVLLKHADSALYSSKTSGKNKFEFYDKVSDQKLRIKNALVEDLSKGILSDKFSLVFQPIVSAQTRKFVGMEALLRFNDHKDTLVMPNDFVPLLEGSGLIVTVGRWVVEQTCKKLRVLLDQNAFPIDGYVSINVSAKQLVDTSFVSIVKQCCIDHNILPSMLVIEVTETTIINKPELAQEMLNQLRSFGVRTALDDFGTGYSSMTHLQKYEFDIIKIDKSFIDDIETNLYNMRIVRAIISLANSFQLEVTAEGVEQEKDITLLDSLGVSNVQGFAMARPMNLSGCIDFIREQQVH